MRDTEKRTSASPRPVLPARGRADQVPRDGGDGHAALAAKARLASLLTVDVEAKAKELAVTRWITGLHGEKASHAC
ncbi:MAG: hypothetical protein D6761_12390 [Candidatus Dadabacteria bacterium]|nr:MAG: hypothetical protein D6761_12390 [Candidatus Dadabacteria bacterium]